MTEGKAIEKSEITVALSKLNELCKDEYGIELEQLLLDTSPIAATRMQRLTGIVLKQEFATPSPLAGYSATEARRSWPWKDSSPEASAADAQKEFDLLNQLRMPGPWNERKPRPGSSGDETPITWEEFRYDVEQERGLFKVVALYVADKVQGRERKTLREYLDTKESRRFEAGLDLAELLFDAAVMGPIAGVLGVPTVAVGVALVGIQYGYRRLTEQNEGRLGDRNN